MIPNKDFVCYANANAISNSKMSQCITTDCFGEIGGKLLESKNNKTGMLCVENDVLVVVAVVAGVPYNNLDL